MARKRRLVDPGLPLHVTQRGNNRGTIFHDDSDRIRYLDYLAEATDRYSCAVHCYALMNNHVHLLLTPPNALCLAKCMHSLNGRYVPYFNRVHERTGGLYDGRYAAKIVDNDAYLKACYQYIELNPVKDGYCATPADYRWSSHRYHAVGTPSRIVIPHRCYLALGDTSRERQTRYQRWFSELSTGV